jgi:hypothetical protein
MKTLALTLTLMTAATTAYNGDFSQEEITLVRDLVENQGPQSVIDYISVFDIADRIDLYNLARELYVFNQFEGQNLDDLVTVIDFAIEDILGMSREEEAALIRMELLDQANIMSFNLSADLAECWPGDTLTRYTRHFERGLSAALQCIEWRYFLEKDDYPFFLAFWAAGMHQLSLGRPEEAIYNLVRSMNYAEQITVDAGRPLGFHAGAGYELLLAHGYFGLAQIVAGESSEHYYQTFGLLIEGIDAYGDFVDDYRFAVDQLDWARANLENR